MSVNINTSSEVNFDQINYFSYLDKWWIRLGENCINIGWKELPLDVHLTLSFHPNSEDVNIHLTRNVETVGRKPAIELIKIGKQFLSKYLERIAPLTFEHTFKATELPTYLKNDPSVCFFPFNILDSEEHPEILRIKKFMERKLKSASQKKGNRRLKVQNDLEKVFSGVGTLNKFHRFFDRTVEKLPKNIAACPRNGMVIVGSKPKLYFLIEGKLYQHENFKVDFSLSSLLLGTDKEKLLKSNLKKAIEIIKLSNTYEEAQSGNIEPIIIE